MKFAWSAATILLIAAAVPAQAMSPGHYRGKGKSAGLDVTVSGKHFEINVGLPGCIGSAEGILRKIGNGHWRVVNSDPGDEPECTLDIRQVGSRFKISETDCLAWHGAGCSFDGTVSR